MARRGPFRRSEHLRLLSVALVVVLAWAGIGFRLFQIQIVHAADLTEAGKEQREKIKTLAPDRGTIFDRNGRELAITVEGRTIGADTDKIDQVDSTAQILAANLGVDAQEIRDRLSGERRWVTVARHVDMEVAGAIAELDLPGIYSYPEPMRVYPEGSLAGQVIGFVDPDGNGLEGLEFRYNDALTGTPGQLRVEQDLEGRIIPQGEYEIDPAIPGSDLVTTIDRDIQFIAERECQATLERTDALRCTAVVLDPATSEILAMAVVPGFDPNDRSEVPPERWTNWAVLGTFEPGSTEKLITVSAALEEGAVRWDTRFDVPDRIEVQDGACEKGNEIYGCYRDAERHDTESMSVKDIVTRSSNVGTILVQEQLGDEPLARYIDLFGLGRKTGADVPGEAEGRLNLEPGCGSCYTSAAIGYAVSVTPLQMTAAYATIANGGVWIQPHLVRELVDGSGARRSSEPSEHRVVSEDTASIMRMLLRNVVESEHGTGSNARVAGYTTAGKTGTTRKYDPRKAVYTDQYVASFIGFAPATRPRIVVGVVVDAPQNEIFGGTVAAPAFAAIVEDTLHHLGVPPDAS